jgi:hypothetical protein
MAFSLFVVGAFLFHLGMDALLKYPDIVLAAKVVAQDCLPSSLFQLNYQHFPD